MKIVICNIITTPLANVLQDSVRHFKIGWSVGEGGMVIVGEAEGGTFEVQGIKFES